MNDIRPEDLGSMGESFFNTLCKNNGFVANSSKSDDKGGWDFEVEYRRINEINYSSQSYPVYRVQVKATSSDIKTQLTYSNLLKLIQFNGASFIVLIKYSKDINPDSAYIFHIDEDFSKKIWKEIRTKQIKSSKFALNKNEKTIRFSSENQIIPLDGAGLEKMFNLNIGMNYLRYVDNKLKFLSKLEHEGQTNEFDLTFNNKNDVKSMANCFLGYKQDFNVDVVKYFAPFGIRDKKPVLSIANHKTTITPIDGEHKDTTAYLKTSKYGTVYIFTGLSFTVPKQLRFAVQKSRTKFKMFDLIFDDKSRSLSFDFKNIFTDELNVKIKELHNYICFLVELKSSKEMYIQLVNLENIKTPEMCLETPMTVGLADDLPMYSEIIGATYRKLCEWNLENNEISTKYMFNYIGRFNLFNIINKKYEPEYILEFENIGIKPLDVDVVIFNSTIEVKDKYLITFVAFYGTVERVRDNMLQGRFKHSKALGEFLLSQEDDADNLIKIQSEHFNKTLVANGFKVLDQ